MQFSLQYFISGFTILVWIRRAYSHLYKYRTG